jgi:hypothetical protein
MVVKHVNRLELDDIRIGLVGPLLQIEAGPRAAHQVLFSVEAGKDVQLLSCSW